MIDLKQFCGRNDVRYYLNEPFSEGEFTYATNGHIIVRVPKIDGMGDCKSDAMKIAARKLFDENKAGDLVNLPDVLPALEYLRCLDCEGKGSFSDPVANNAKSVCEECEGTGKTAAIQQVDIGNSHFALKYIRQLKELPNCKISPNEQKPAPFTFDVGDGLLMPMRKF